MGFDFTERVPSPEVVEAGKIFGQSDSQTDYVGLGTLMTQQEKLGQGKRVSKRFMLQWAMILTHPAGQQLYPNDTTHICTLEDPR
jgi:hypothetical protein